VNSKQGNALDHGTPGRGRGIPACDCDGRHLPGRFPKSRLRDRAYLRLMDTHHVGPAEAGLRRGPGAGEAHAPQPLRPEGQKPACRLSQEAVDFPHFATSNLGYTPPA